jgi:hypothetical protein
MVPILITLCGARMSLVKTGIGWYMPFVPLNVIINNQSIAKYAIKLQQRVKHMITSFLPVEMSFIIQPIAL